MENINNPYGKIHTITQLAECIRKKRQALGLTQKRVAGLCGVGVRFLSELERGKKTIELGRALRVTLRLGLDILVVPRNKSSHH